MFFPPLPLARRWALASPPGSPTPFGAWPLSNHPPAAASWINLGSKEIFFCPPSPSHHPPTTQARLTRHDHRRPVQPTAGKSQAMRAFRVSPSPPSSSSSSSCWALAAPLSCEAQAQLQPAAAVMWAAVARPPPPGHNQHTPWACPVRTYDDVGEEVPSNPLAFFPHRMVVSPILPSPPPPHLLLPISGPPGK